MSQLNKMSVFAFPSKKEVDNKTSSETTSGCESHDIGAVDQIVGEN